MKKDCFTHVEVSFGSFQLLIDFMLVAIELLVNLQVEELFSLIVRIDKQVSKLRYMNQNRYLMKKCWNEETSERMINVLTVTLKVRVNLFLAKMQSISPINMSTFQQSDFRILTVIFLFKSAVAKAGIYH